MSNPPARSGSRPQDPFLRQALLVAVVVGFLGVTYLILASGTFKSISVPVPVTDLSVYHVIQESDLTTKTLAVTTLPQKFIDKRSDLIGKFTLESLSATKPVTAEQVLTIPARTLITPADTVVIGIPATPAMVLGGNLKPGNMVDILITPAVTGTPAVTATVVFSNVLILDVKPLPGSETKPPQSMVVILALPANRLSEFVALSANGTVAFTRRLMP